METLTDELRDLLLEDEIYNNIMKDAVKKILEKTDEIRDVLLAEEIFNIIKDVVKKILEKTVELCLNGTARYDKDLEASQNLAYLDYKYEEIINEIDWGGWNFSRNFYNTTCKSK